MIFQENNLNNEDIQNFIDKPKSKMSLRASSLAEILRLEGSTSAEKVKTFVKDLTRDVPLRENDMKRLLNKFNFLSGQVRSIICGFCLCLLIDRMYMFYVNGGMKNPIALNILGIIMAIFILLLLLILNK